MNIIPSIALVSVVFFFFRNLYNIVVMFIFTLFTVSIQLGKLMLMVLKVFSSIHEKKFIFLLADKSKKRIVAHTTTEKFIFDIF